MAFSQSAPAVDTVCRIMLRKSLPPALLAGTVTALIQLVLGGATAGWSGLFGVLVAVAFFASALLAVPRFVTDGNPLLFLAVGMTVYFAQVIGLLGVLVLARSAEVLQMRAAGIAMLVVVLVWQVAQVRAWQAARVPLYDDVAPDGQESA